MHGSVWDMHVICMEYVWNTYALCIRNMGSAWYMYGMCMQYAGDMHGICVETYGICMEYVWGMYAIFCLITPSTPLQTTTDSKVRAGSKIGAV